MILRRGLTLFPFFFYLSVGMYELATPCMQNGNVLTINEFLGKVVRQCVQRGAFLVHKIIVQQSKPEKIHTGIICHTQQLLTMQSGS